MMKKNTLRVIKLVSILLAGLLLSGCAGLTQLEEIFTKGTEAPETHQTTKKPNNKATEPTVAVDPEAVFEDLQASISEERNIAVAYLGHFAQAPEDLNKALKESLPVFCEQYPFVLEVAEDRILGECGDLFCIVTREATASVSVSKSADGEYAYDQNVAILDGAGVVLLFANSAGWGPDTLVNITDSTGSYYWYPLLNDYLCTAQMLDADWNERLVDITPYTEQLRASYRDRLETGWKLPSHEDLVGNTWSCTEWTNDGTMHHYEVTFGKETAYVHWNDSYDVQGHEYPAAPYTFEIKDGYAVVTFDFDQFAGILRFNFLLNETSGMLYTMLDVTGDEVVSGWDRLYRTLE